MARQTIAVSILAEASGVRKGVDQANGYLGRMEGRARTLGRVLKGALVGGAVAAGFKEVISSASDAQQSLGATETVFGKYASTVIKRSKEAAQSVGLSANEYRELSNTTGAMLKSTGQPLEKVAALTDQLNVRAADLAATFGGTTKEAVSAVGSLLRGEADPIERYGVSIKQSDVNARLASQGLDKLTGAALKQAEQQARLDLLFEQTASSAGQFARESNTLAGQQQRLGASWENIKATVGTYLLPALTAAFSWLNDRLPGAFETVRREATEFAIAARPVAEALRDAFVDALPAIREVGGWLLDHKSLIVGVITAYAGFRVVVATLRTYRATVMAIKTAQQAYALATYGMATANGTLLTSLASTAGALRVKLGAMRASMAATRAQIAMDARWQIMLLKQRAAIIAQAAAQKTAAAASKVMAAGQWALNAAMSANPLTLVIAAVIAIGAALVIAYRKSETFRNIVNGAWDGVKTGAAALWSAIKTAFDWIKQKVQTVAGLVRGYIGLYVGAFRLVIAGAKATWDGIRSAFDWIKTKVQQVGAAVRAGVRVYLNAWQSIINGARQIVSGVASALGSVLSTVRGIPGRILGALGNIGSLLWNAGWDVIQGFIRGISSAIGGVKDTLGGLTRKLTSWKGPERVDKRILYRAGRLVIGGFRDGLGRESVEVKRDLRAFTTDLQRQVERPMRLTTPELTSAITGRASLTTEARAAGRAGGTTIVHVKVDVPLGTSKGEVGRELAEALGEYVRMGGTVPTS